MFTDDMESIPTSAPGMAISKTNTKIEEVSEKSSSEISNAQNEKLGVHASETAINEGLASAPKVHYTRTAVIMWAAGAFGGFLFGYDSGYINGVMAMPKWIMDIGHPSTDVAAVGGYMLHSWQRGLIVSILSAGTVIGSLSTGWFAQKFGRRVAIMTACLIYTIGVVLQTASGPIGGLPLLVTGRLIGGLGVGIISASVIMYLGETTPKQWRGRITSGYQMAITIGLFIAAIFDNGTKDRTDTLTYRLPIGFQFIPAIILALGIFVSPESPRYLVTVGKRQEAAQAMSKIRGEPENTPALQAELSEFVANYEYESEHCQGGILACFKRDENKRVTSGSNLGRTLVGTLIQMFQQLTGINFIFYFGTTFFVSAGIKKPFIIAIVTGLVNVLCTPISFGTIERFGRRPLLIYGAIAMCIFQMIVASVGTFVKGPAASGIIVAFVCLFIASFACTWAPTAWVVCGEIFPSPIRSNGIALSTGSNWIWNLVIGLVTPFLVDKSGANLQAKVFYIWGTTSAFCALFAYFCVYETKGLSLEQIDQMFEDKNCSPRKSSKWVPGETFAEKKAEAVKTS